MNIIIKTACVVATALSIGACQNFSPLEDSGRAKQLSVEDFIAQANVELAQAAKDASHAAWLSSTYINIDSQTVAAKAFQEYNQLSVKYAKKAATYDEALYRPEISRQLQRLKLDLVLPAPDNDVAAKRLADVGVKMEAMYGAGKYCNAERCYNLDQMTKLFAESRDPELLQELWQGWRSISPPMRKLYKEQVEIANAGAQDLGFTNLSELWRSNYDMDADAFSADVDQQWQKVKPLYDALQCHVRSELNEYYGDQVVPKSGKIPAHLLGNMWAQTWDNVYPLVKPENSEQSYDLTELIVDSGMSEIEMVKTGEAFFSSLGFEPLPESFWQRSQFIRPRDREVVCHASAWNVDNLDDLRIKMCIQKTAEDFQTIHHELGHNYYQRAYNDQPFVLRNSANDGFHEALGDTVGLSMTPSYLVQLGLLQKEPPVEEDLGYLMNMALSKIAFLPFGLLVDKWRWQVFNGEIAPEDYNKGWWQLREKYQGVAAPVGRSEQDFDPGAKYHIPGNTPYTRYFLAFIQQFQFHQALCNEIGYEGPLHRCSIYNQPKAGEKLKAMMQLGRSQPWPDAMEALTGQRELDASAIIDYFSPLMVWLNDKNKDRQCGW